MGCLERHKRAASLLRRFEDATGHFGRAIALDGRCEVYYSNRAAALTALKKYAEALEDARAVVRLKPNWAKGCARHPAAPSPGRRRAGGGA